jgi:hypothetical protein
VGAGAGVALVRQSCNTASARIGKMGRPEVPTPKIRTWGPVFGPLAEDANASEKNKHAC